ncbi:sperm-associated antigen 17 [Embiotoca jacksoni]|uniref:sperm-associated antigen 17 n=1 Tax=Embiotoca jacksoni TaxID=100190 RepID=UPI003703E043
MPPKAAKKPPAKKPGTAAVANKNWEAGLTGAPFEEVSWQASVSLVVGRSPEEDELNRALALAVQQPQRKLFTVLTWDSTIAKIHELGNPKVKKSQDVPVFYEVTEPAKVLLDAGEEIPCDLMAKILKFQLLQIKTSDQCRRKAEKVRVDEEKAKDSKDKGGDKGGDKASDKKGKRPPSSMGPSKEKKTKLKRRDDVEPPTFLDDEPEHGPQHYILLLGFHQLFLIGMLDAIGVHVANVIQLCSEHTQTLEGQQEERSGEGNEQGVGTCPVLDAELKERGCSELVGQAGKLDLLWSGLRPVLDRCPPDSKLHDLVQLSYTVPELLFPVHTLDPEAVLELGSSIFDGVANLIYDCVDWRRQHQHYRDNVKLVSVPTVFGLDSLPAQLVVPPVVPPVLPTTPQSKKKPVQEVVPPNQETKLPPLSIDMDMCYYSSLLDLVPTEACSVPLILHCMLEQVAINAEPPLPTPPPTAEEPKPSHGFWLDNQLVSFMLQSFLPLTHTEEDRSYMLNNILSTIQNEEDKKRLVHKFVSGETQKQPQQPLVIRHHDERALRLRDIRVVPGFNPAEVESSMMRLSPVWELIQSVAQQRNSNSCWMPIKQQLQHYCTDGAVRWSEVERLFHQSVFETMPLTRLDHQGVLLNDTRPMGTPEPAEQQTPTIIPWDNPFSFAKQQLDNLRAKAIGPTFLTEDPASKECFSGRVCGQLDLSDIQSCRLRSLFDWHYTEHHDASVFPQLLQLASEEYCCLDTFRGTYNNVLYIFCHNPLSPHRQFKEFWDVALHTDVKFRKYLEHVADTISSWTEEEELKREAMQIKNDTPAESSKDEKALCFAEEDTLEPFIRKESLKAWKLEQERLKEEELAKKSKKEGTPKGKQQKETSRATANKTTKTLPDGKKSRPGTAGSRGKGPAESNMTAPPGKENKELHLTEEPFNGFTGYSMDGKLIHVSGHLQSLFPSDGGHITVENISFVEGSCQMKVAVKKDGHHFYTHINQVVVVEPAKPPPEPQDKTKADPKDDCKGSEPVQMKRVKQGSFSALLENNIHLSYSFYGPTGEYAVRSQETKGGIPETSTIDSIPLSSSTHCSKGTELESEHSTIQTSSSLIQPPETQGWEGQPDLPSSPFNSLNLSVPNGLLLQFVREDTQGVSLDEKGVLVRQSFPLHAQGEVRHLQDTSLSKELSRVITSQGAVIRYMRDASTQVLFADGSVSFSQDSGPVWVPDSNVLEENSHQEAENNKKQSSEKEAETPRGCWLTTTPSGDRICTVGTTHTHIPTTSLLSIKATDPLTHQVMLTREDLVISVHNPDGSVIVEHADGTRITRFFQEKTLNATTPSLLHTGDQPENVTLKSTSCAESVCVTRCVDSNNDNVHNQTACDNAEKISSAGTKEGSVHACTEFSEYVQMCDEKESAERCVHKNDEQNVFAEETVTKNGKTSVCESNKGSVSTKERVVLVEKEGCATVVMYPERHTAHMFLADGTVITGNNQGDYQVFPSRVGLLEIQRDGKCMYSSDPPVTPRPKGCTPTNQPGIYTMSHTEKVACDITDPDGNHFQVMEDGQISVLNFSPVPSTLKHHEEELEEEDREMAKLHVNHREHCPRLFLVREDGSGTELLSSHTVEEMLYQAYSDPTIALLKEPLPDTQGEFGITILKPSHKSVWSQWLLDKQNPDITPPNLRKCIWDDFSRVAVQRKSPGPPFGTDVGRGLTLKVGFAGSAAQHQPVRSCPKVLEMRELYQHRPFTTPLKNTIDSRLKEYIETLIERQQKSEEMKVKDPLTKEQNTENNDLFNLILCFAGKDDEDHTIDKQISVDVASLYSQGVKSPREQSYFSEDSTTAPTESSETLECFTNEKDSKWTENLSQYRKKMCEEKTYKEALMKKNVLPYFHPENILLYQSLLHNQMPNMRSLSMDLPPIPWSDSPEAFLKDTPQENSPRPPNPTPSQSASHVAGSDKKPDERPTNPTPQTAGESSLKGLSRQYKSVQVDVTGKLRRTKVRLPTSILGSKPCSVQNQQFLTVEEPVRRKCRTISQADPNSVVRGFQLLPSRVDFGTLREGTSSTIIVLMKNVGVDTCRFHVKQRPPATGLRIIYIPGPVAAGLQVELQIELFAICGAQAGEVERKKCIAQDIVIHTETDILYLPITATILPERLYDIWLKENTGVNKKRGSRVFQPSSESGNRAQMSQHPPDQSSSKRRTY